MTPTDSDPATLSGITLFRGLPARELERLAPLLHHKTFPSGTNVISAEERETVYT